MAKAKSSKGASTAPNKHLYSRISYLYQAAAYLSSQDSGCHPKTANAGSDVEAPTKLVIEDKRNAAERLSDQILAHHLISQMREVSLKGQIRLSPDIKGSICKRCNSIFTPVSAASRVENLSRGGKKPWADVLVIECLVCGAEKRYPVGASRQQRRSERLPGIAQAGRAKIKPVEAAEDPEGGG